MKNIIIFASGSGSNAENIAQYFKDSITIKVVAVFTNNASAGVINRMEKFNIPCIIFKREEYKNETLFLNKINTFEPDLIVLAGFLWLVPEYLVNTFPNNIINIHPALLPKFGGKGMYGMHVHQAVNQAKETETGITIHYVNNRFDEGKTIFNAKTSLTENDTPESIATKIHELEMAHFPRVIEKVLSN